MVVVATQETWFKKKRFNEKVQRMLANGLWSWHGKVRRRQKRKDKKGSGGIGFLVHASAGEASLHPTRANGVMWLELRAHDTSTHVINLYLVPTCSPRIHHNDNALEELERVLASTGGGRRVILGDWNARIGERPSIVSTGKEEEQGDTVLLEEKEYTRASTDKHANPAGNKMMDFMNAQDMIILNGTSGTMQHTQRGSIGWSVVDYVAVSSNMHRAGIVARAIEGSDVKSLLIMLWWWRVKF